MADSTDSDHIQVNIQHAADQMGVILNSGCVVTIFPECAFSIFPYIVRLGCATGDQLYGLGQRMAMPRILDKKMNMIRCNGKIEYRQRIPLFRLIQPTQPAFAIPGEFKQKLLFVAPMGNVPYQTRYVISISPWHNYPARQHFS